LFDPKSTVRIAQEPFSNRRRPLAAALPGVTPSWRELDDNLGDFDKHSANFFRDSVELLFDRD
jgi:hypothetical protein